MYANVEAGFIFIRGDRRGAGDCAAVGVGAVLVSVEMRNRNLTANISLLSNIGSPGPIHAGDTAEWIAMKHSRVA